jgi:hypothetical protein
MKYAYAPRVSMPFMDLSGTLTLWSKSCESIIVFEHESDEEVTQTHCHVLMLGSEYATAEPLKRIFYKQVETNRKGNDLWAWTHNDFPVPDISFIRYMGKGNLRPIFYQGSITIERIMMEVGKWSDYKTQPKMKDPKEKSEFDLLLLAAEAAIKAKKLTVSMSDIARFIKSHYLRRRKAVPRKSDTNRYAYSIYAIVNELCHENLIEQVDRQALIENIEF